MQTIILSMYFRVVRQLRCISGISVGRAAVLCLFLIGCSFPAWAQKPGFGRYNPTKDRFGNNTLTIQTVPMFFHGYGVEYSRNIYRQKHYLKISPVIYTFQDQTKINPVLLQKMFGYSVGLYHQYNYFEIEEVGFRMFFQWGVSYHNFDLVNVAQASNHIEKFGLDAAIGFRQNIAKPLYFEFYLGYGQRWLTRSQIDNSAVSPSVTDVEALNPYFDSNIFDYGRGGSVFVVGLNIGFLF